MGRLIVVSNRVQPISETGAASTGGLAMALSAALQASSGVWFGWSGRTIEHFTGEVATERAGAVTIATLDLEEQDRQEYYNGYANKTLWPLFHYRTDLTAYERSFDAGYERVNERFAAALAPMIGPNDFIWVHDYHLIPLARELRRHGLANRIGFFLHIPWPSRRVLTTLPRHRELVEALLDYDLIGFQTEDSRDAFAGYITDSLGGTVSPGGLITVLGRTSRVGAFPIGIDLDDFAKGAASPAARESFRRMRRSMTGRKMILGVDRLDYSKGIEERFLAYEQFLADGADQLENVFLLQIATLSRDEVEAYQDLRARLDAVSGRINGAYATMDWVPLRYVNKSYRRDELAGIYRAAHVGLVTPLRDGMNLVAKEYVAAQDPDDPGVLVLSQFAGAAEAMRAALIVNPFGREDVAEAIRRALGMPRRERVSRWRDLLATVRDTDVGRWRDNFIGALLDTPGASGCAGPSGLQPDLSGAVAGRRADPAVGLKRPAQQSATPQRHHQGLKDISKMHLRTAVLGLAVAATPGVVIAAKSGVKGPLLLGAPLEFYLFGLTLAGVALFHRRTLEVALIGLGAVIAYQALVSGFPTGFGLSALGQHLLHEWVILSNLMLLLVGFELLSNQFERSNLPDRLPNLLPDNWTGGLALLALVFVMSAFLDNIAAAVIGGVMARHVYKGRVRVAFLVAIVACANAGGAGSVIGDTTTTIMWLHGVSPITVLPAFLAAVVALAVCGLAGARAQHRFQPILASDETGHPLEWRRVWIVVFVLLAAVATNITANALTEGEETAPWLGLAVWAALLATAWIAKPDWSVARPAVRGATFLVALVAAASLMPVHTLPDPSWQTALGLGFLSAVFDNIPLTALALKQGGYDWALLAYAVGFGGSMVWFGSSAGVALTNLYPEGRSVWRWVREGWFVPVAYVLGFAVMLLLLGWNPSAAGAP